jgi:hypothetical protein
VMINWISHLTEEKSASFPLNMVLGVFRNLDPIHLPFSLLCVDRRINYVYGWRAHF